MRSVMVVAALLAALSQTSGAAPPAPEPAEARRTDILPYPRPMPPPQGDGLCRRAPDLPQLAQEPRGQQQQPSRWTSRDRASATPPPPAPPPPPMPGVVYESAPTTRSDSAVAAAPVVRGRGTSSEKRMAEPGSTPPAITRDDPPRRGGGNRPVQAGQLTAGEHDDLLNAALYAKYVDGFLASETVQGIPRVDTGKVVSVVVTDTSGAPVPFATVTMTCTDGNRLSLTTQADGRAVFFPDLDRLGSSVTMVASSGQRGTSPSRAINISDVRGAQEVRTRLSVQAPRVTKFDLAVVIDATGSMGDEIAYLKAELASIVGSLSRRNRGLDIRVGMVVYRDQGDEFVTRTYEFTSDMGLVQRNLNMQQAGGGGDTPEAMEVAMSRAVGLNWRDDAIKSMLLVADAPPHSGDVPLTWTATEVARAKRIQIVPVAASGVDDAAQYIMRAMAAATQSRYAFLTDDSGIGNAHAEPSVDCYQVTKLDALVRRILDAQISGRRIEPENNEIIRTVGDYDRGKCRGVN